MKRRGFLITMSFGIAAISGASAADGRERPNIVLIMADDMGYSDIGCYGGEIETPHLDALAANGLRYTQFYNGARCCPTRASLLTGLYAHQAGMGCMEPDWHAPGYRGRLNSSCVTLAEALKTAGYSTYMTGKWHVTNTARAKAIAEKGTWPRQRGFDRFYGTIVGAGSFFNPRGLTRDNDDITKEATENPDFYYTDAIADNTVSFIDEHVKSDPDRPFFHYVAFTAPHWPLHARKKDIDRYRGEYTQGWDKLRERRYQRMRELGVISGNVKLSARTGYVPAWEEVPGAKMDKQLQSVPGMSADKLQEYVSLKMSIYAAQIDSMDQGIGRIVESLRRNRALDSTLIIFLADNGGCAEYGNYGFGIGERNATEKVGGPKSWASYGAGWACASNTPFRYYKHYIHEGGISTPLIVHWPAGIQDRGAIRKAPVCHVMDLMPTFLELAGGTYPAEHKGNKITPMQGTSVVPTFARDIPHRRQPIFWEHHGNRAVRHGRWKLVASGQKGPWELYDMDADRSETINLARELPARVEELGGLWEQWARRSQVYPIGLGALRRAVGGGRRDIRIATKEMADAERKGDAEKLASARSKLEAAEARIAAGRKAYEKAYTDCNLPVPELK